MNHFVKHTSCDQCGSKDNRGVWSDGSTWCFGCGAWSPPNSEGIINNYFYMNVKKAKSVRLPEDAQPFLPNHAKEWLDKYDLTKEQISALSPLYSFEKHLLIFPVYDKSKLLMYQGRYFGDNPKHPKYLTYGAKDVLHILGNDSESICVVEDLISAVKVSTVMSCMPVWGSKLSSKDATRLSKMYSNLFIWLDYDKASESVKQRQALEPLFKSAVNIITKLDPKEHSHEEIAKLVQQAKSGW